jgi:hypothetical protein
MTEARIPTPRRIARTPVVRQPSAFSALGDALSVAGAAGQQFENRRFAAEQQVEEIDHRIALDEQRRQDDALFIEKAAEWAKLEEQAKQRAAELRSEGSYRDHPDRVRKELDALLRPFDESLAGNERVRQRFRLGIVQSAARIDAQEEGWARQEGFRVQGESLKTYVSTRRNQLSRGDPAQVEQDFATYVAEGDALIDAGAYNDEQAAQMKRALRTELVPGLTESLFNAGQPDAVKKLIDDGFFDEFDLDVAKLGDKVVAERTALDLAAQREQAAKLAEARAAADAIEAKVRLGINPTQEEFDAVNSQLAAAGAPEAERIEFGGLSIEMGLNRQYGEARDPDGIAAAQAASALQAKVAAGTATEAEQVAARHLSGVAEARAKAAGAQRRELAAQGVQGQMAVLADLDRMPPEQRFIAANEAKDGLGYVAQLRPHARQFALAGREARKARPDDFGTKEEVRAAFSRNVGAFAGMLGGSYDGIMNLAWDLYAGGITSEGGAGWDAARFRQSVHVAFGARKVDGVAYGGLGNFNGAVILPTYQTGDEFERSVRGLTFAGATYADGRAAVKADVLDNYRPEYVRDSEDGRPMYRMIDESGRPLGRKGGGVYEFVAPPRATAKDLSGWMMPGMAKQRGGR